MGNKQSAAMDKARKLIEGGMPAPAAAIKAGVAVNGIYRKDWWKAHQKARAQKEQS